MYKNYIFDLYGTLIDIRTDENQIMLYQKMIPLYASKGANYEAQELKDAYNQFVSEEYKEISKEHPEFSEHDIDIVKVFNRFLSHKGISEDIEFAKFAAESFRTFSTNFIKLYDGVIDLLESLKKADKRIYLLSNAQESFTLPEMKKLNIYKFFDGIVISSNELCKKPDPAFFNILINRYNLNKTETVMIGNDYISDIKGAYDVGINSLYIHQEISPRIDGKLYSKYTVMDGDVTKIKQYLLKDRSEL
ncbi:MAG: HAD family hydrolase [Bacillota bacterium]|nr:HAD family hydrolase [Bacillota bacterium]